MRFAVKALPLGALGCAAALLVACGDRSGLLSSPESGSLQDALVAVQSACAGGDAGRAAVAARSFADRVDALSGGTVDRRLFTNLEEGAATLEALVTRTCTRTTPTATTPTVTTTAPTTTTDTTTAPTGTTAPPTTTTAPPTTPTTTPTPIPPDDGRGGGRGGGEPPGNSGGAPGLSGGAPPGQLKKALKQLEQESKR
jgi:hypothetical protein